MKLAFVNLQNFRGIDDLKLNLEQRLTVLVGRNGVGKSTVLDATALLLSWVVGRAKSTKSAGRQIKELDVKNKKSFAALHAILENSELSPIEWTIVKTLKGHKKSESATDLQSVNEFGKRLQETITETNEQTNIPLFAYYPVNRAVLDIPLRIRTAHDFNLLAAWDDSLTSGSNFRSFFEWFRDREDLENENRLIEIGAGKTESRTAFDPQLQAVRQAVENVIPGFKSLSVRRKPLRMTISKSGEEIQIDQLSDGEKCLIAMVGDIARRLAIANPMLANPLDGEGVVLIDEIDLHLHPGWQRIVVPYLMNTFKSLQFLVSTHSPQVLGEVPPECVRLFVRENQRITFSTPEQTIGLTTNEILDELMASDDAPVISQNVKVDAKLRDLYLLIDEEEFEPARSMIEALKTEYRGNTPDLIRAESLLTMLAPVNGKQE